MVIIMHEEYIHLTSFHRCPLSSEPNNNAASSGHDKLSLVNFIYEHDHSVPDELCDNITEMFDSETNKQPGNTYGGVQKHIKDTTDFMIPRNNKTWEKISNFLLKELHKHLKLYHKTMNEDYQLQNLLPQHIFIESFMIQHYKRGVGKYTYHNDGQTSYNLHKRRIITYIFYLNDVTEGGQTEFFNEYQITPKKGKIVLFPANWCYPHCGKMPVSNDKYIITGWVYTDET